MTDAKTHSTRYSGFSFLNGMHHLNTTTCANTRLTHLLMTFFPVAGAADTGAVWAAVWAVGVFLGTSAFSTSETSLLTALRSMASRAIRAKRERERGGRERDGKSERESKRERGRGERERRKERRIEREREGGRRDIRIIFIRK